MFYYALCLFVICTCFVIFKLVIYLVIWLPSRKGVIKSVSVSVSERRYSGVKHSTANHFWSSTTLSLNYLTMICFCSWELLCWNAATTRKHYGTLSRLWVLTQNIAYVGLTFYYIFIDLAVAFFRCQCRIMQSRTVNCLCVIYSITQKSPTDRLRITA